MRVVVESLNKRFDYLRPRVEKIVKRAARLLKVSARVGGLYLEVYLARTGHSVLSFPAPPDFPRPDLKGKRPLGEIYLDPGYIKRRGENLFFLLIHGFLHLSGYDHKKKDDRIFMEKEEKRVYLACKTILSV